MHTVEVKVQSVPGSDFLAFRCPYNEDVLRILSNQDASVAFFSMAEKCYMVNKSHVVALVDEMNSDVSRLFVDISEVNGTALVGDRIHARVLYIPPAKWHGDVKDRNQKIVSYDNDGGSWLYTENLEGNGENGFSIIMPVSVMASFWNNPVAKPTSIPPTITSEDPYVVLGVTKTIAQDAIRKAYLKRLKVYHPDVNSKSPSAQEDTRKITEAFTLLNDPNEREFYDMIAVTVPEVGVAVVRPEKPDYKIPYNCGLFELEVMEYEYHGKAKWYSGQRYRAMKILSYAPIKNERGQTMVSSWLKDDKSPRIAWR